MTKSPTLEQVRKLRGARTQAEAAELLHVSTRTWQAWELGQNPMPPGMWALAKLVMMAKKSPR